MQFVMCLPYTWNLTCAYLICEFWHVLWTFLEVLIWQSEVNCPHVLVCTWEVLSVKKPQQTWTTLRVSTKRHANIIECWPPLQAPLWAIPVNQWPFTAVQRCCGTLTVKNPTPSLLLAGFGIKDHETIHSFDYSTTTSSHALKQPLSK